MNGPNSLLPILRADAPTMGLCSICPKPGHCCEGFELAKRGEQLTYWKDSWREDAEAYLSESGLPFQIDEIHGEYKNDEGREYVTVWYRCPNLLPSGRCGIYEDRPYVCRDFIPGMQGGNLCVMSNPPFRFQELDSSTIPVVKGEPPNA